METKITTVAAQGEAEAPFTLAHFHLNLVATATTVPVAKTRLGVAISQLNAALEALKTNLSLDFVKNSLRTSSSVQDVYDYNRTTGEQTHKGYNINYYMSFDIDNLDRVGAVYDALTYLNVSDTANVKLTISNPDFSLKNRDRLNKRALKNAFRQVQDRFETECEVLGLDPLTFEIVSWEANYSDSQRSDRVGKNMRSALGRPAASALGGKVGEAFGAASEDIGGSVEGAGMPVIDFNVGLATVTVNLEVGYTRRAPRAIHATGVAAGNSKSVSETASHDLSV